MFYKNINTNNNNINTYIFHKNINKKNTINMSYKNINIKKNTINTYMFYKESSLYKKSTLPNVSF